MTLRVPDALGKEHDETVRLIAAKLMKLVNCLFSSPQGLFSSPQGLSQRTLRCINIFRGNPQVRGRQA